MRDGDSSGESKVPTRYAVRCLPKRVDVGVPGHFVTGPACDDGELIYLTEECYSWQMNRPQYGWICPRCSSEARWDDDNYEREDLEEDERLFPIED